MPELHISDEVRAVIGDEAAARESARPLTRALCTSCGQRLDGTVNLQVRTDGKQTRTEHVHATCAPSAVLPLTGSLTTAAEETMHLVLDVLDHGGAALPVLIAQTAGTVYEFRGPDTDLTDAVTAKLLAAGFTLISRVRQAPRPAEEWIAVLLLGHGPAGEDGLLVLEPDGAQFYGGAVVIPDGWLAAVARYGWGVLYVGEVGLPHLPPEPKARLKALREAAQAGRLVGARIAVGGPPSPTGDMT
ncbi:hypothetical protein ACFY12_34105 [Streptomyces sp. NPDC001339]|uniref:hypothetical protein n=1 Tax=Streptomyces sp. NPDC001339 TaxID=3364563 RepID=UPI00368240AA